MGMRALDPVAYGKLLAAELPKPIQTARDFDRMVAQLEEMDFAKRKLTPEEEALREILAALIEVYDQERHHITEQPPCEMVRYLMELRGLKQVDLVPVLGSRAQVSDLVNGKRAISKAQVKKLAGYFGVSAELFLYICDVGHGSLAHHVGLISPHLLLLLKEGIAERVVHVATNG